MANPSSSTPSNTGSSSSNSASSTPTGAKVSSTIRDAADRFTSQINKSDAKKIVNDASEAVSDLYDDASRWLSENRTVVAYVGVGLAAGLVGYLLGRGNLPPTEEVTRS